jgi:nickel-dependent lactate racemase
MPSTDNETYIEFPYADASISGVRVPTGQLQAVYRLPKATPIGELDDAIRCAVRNPIGTLELKHIVKPDQRIAIIVDDMTRPTPVSKILPIILDELHNSGVTTDLISIVIALGSHRQMTNAEIRAKIGNGIVDGYCVSQSHFDDPEQLVMVGTSEDGVEIYIDKAVARADVKIGIGSIVPHGAVGWSGGGKIIYPGVAGKTTVTQFHFTHGLTESNLTGLDETIVRTRMEKWVEIVGLQFIVNCVLTPESEVFHVVAGHYIAAHREGVTYARQMYVQSFERQSDIVVSISHPHDPDFWQAGKGFYCAESLVRDGGSILVATPCPEGLGLHSSYPERIGNEDNVEIMKAILRGEEKMPQDPLPLAPAAMMAKIRKRIQLHIASPGLTKEMMSKAGIMVHTTVQEGLDFLLRQKKDSTVSVVLSAELCFKNR